MYRWTNIQLPEILLNLFDVNKNYHNYNTRNANDPHRIGIKSDIVNRSFLVDSSKFWALIPNEIKTSNNIKLFTKRLKRWLIQQ